ncbi:MAG: Crp/Fnr family transcriptional regulator [Dehalococcoidales bacterium]|nr:Crp/Fnr family transcriptional regulator [Dehalococcoidales bacterium]
MPINLDTIRGMPYFSGLDDSALAAVSRYFFEKKAVRGDTLVFEGAPAEVLYFVVAGVVKVFKTSADGKEQILHVIRPGDSFNDVPVLGGINLVSAAAMSAAVLNGIKKKDLEALSKEYPRIALNVINVLSQRVQEMIELVEDLSFRNVSGRVAKILLEHIGTGGGENPRLTQQEIAAMIGTAREMVGRSFRTLEEEGAIKIERNLIVITDKAALRKIAGIIE